MKNKERSLMNVLILAAVLMAVMFFLLKISAEAGADYFREDRTVAEADFRKEIRSILSEEGYKNPGINLTKISDNGKTFEYRVLINLPTYYQITEIEKENLIRLLSGIEFFSEDSSVNFSFS
ncbi:MAG: hypothetical protein ILP13_04875 [Lachnospiraceae bacterium]|nr:hypothetical protein [Lachnospiraceae bacterium]